MRASDRKARRNNDAGSNPGSRFAGSSLSASMFY